jgi:DNA-binding PadR family transcriptional regulator
MRNWTEVAFSSIYYILKRLEKQGLINSKTKNVDGRSRKVYTVNDLGKKAMENKVKNLLSEYQPLTDPFDLGLSNLDKVKPIEALTALQSYYASLEVHEDYLKQRLALVDEVGWPIYIRGQITRSMKKLSAEKEWVKDFIKKMSAFFSENEMI